MRAIFHPFENLKKDSTVLITGDQAHHLTVVRVRLNEKILLLNGAGQRVQAEVIVLAKNSIELKIIEAETVSPQHHLCLAIALPKKDAFEDILKMSVELGINEIYPLSSEYSQYEYAKSERIDRILESALIQSNNAFLPKIHPQCDLKLFLQTHESELAFFNSRLSAGPLQNKNSPKKTILIGPEGGFSPSEVSDILNYSQVREIHLPTPILRAPTAVASSVGYLLAQGN